MQKSPDQVIEERAMDLAQSDHLEWVKRPAGEGQPETPDAATNDERNAYRKQARQDLSEEQATIADGKQ